MTNHVVSTEGALFAAMEQATEGDSITIKPGHLMDYEVTTSTEAELIITGGVYVWAPDVPLKSVILHGDSMFNGLALRLEALDNSSAVLYNEGQLVARDQSQCAAYGKVRAEARGESLVQAWESVIVAAFDASTVELLHDATVTEHGSGVTVRHCSPFPAY